MDEMKATEVERRFPCAKCGAGLEFSPGAQALTCSSCGHVNEAPAAEEAVAEEDYAEAIRRLAEGEDRQDCLDVKCSACGAELHGLGSTTSVSCPYCGAHIVATAKSRRLIKPKGVLPFKVTRESARGAFSKWLSALWFAPRDLKRTAFEEGAFGGVYLPAWTFDSTAQTAYVGERGDAYYVTVPYVARVNGRMVTRMRQERRIRWSPAAGQVTNDFDDVLVVASASLPQEKVSRLEPWDLSAVVVYDDAYLSGFGAESYQVELGAGFEEARRLMRPTIERTVRAAIGGDEQRVHSLKTRHEGITFKHLLLPVWVSAYRYRGKVFRFLVNARTGEVIGDRPWSGAKITGAVAAALVVIAVIVVVAVVMSR
jgi:DNA-directed RNA polymerase subunit RPC12/RpoP